MYIKKIYRMSKIHHVSESGGGGGGGGHSNASFVHDDPLFNNQIQTSRVDKKKFAIEINDKDADYDPYQHRTVKHPTT